MFQFNQNTAVKTTKAVAINNATQHDGVVFEEKHW
jgi:hypothetical protein